MCPVDAAAAMPELRELRSLDELDAAGRLLAEIWRAPHPPLDLHVLRALTHAGSYLAGAFDGDRLVGASVGLVGIAPELHLHSHITGVAPDVQGRSLGHELKQRQRRWCAERGIGVVRWTYDPLVRRNAWFNLRRLGAEVEAFHQDFYGAMTDGINAGEPSDRFVVRWDLATAGPRPEPPVDGAVLFPLPEDVIALREEDPATAQRLRLDLREALRGHRVAGVTRDGAYVLVRSG